MKEESESLKMTHKPKPVVYYMHENIGRFHYGARHPMKPQRMAACTDLVFAYGLHNKLEMRQLPKASAANLRLFHAPEYVEFVERLTPRVAEQLDTASLAQFNIGEDCPVFDGIFDFCSWYTGGSLEGACRLNEGANDIVINWAGGLHHAKKSEASGFCYINDIVIAILELLKQHQRVLYIDIDIHHGDGVQEAFVLTDRVMTVSFHKFGNQFFPGTGNMFDLGQEQGTFYSVNVPLFAGIDDQSYTTLFRAVIKQIMECYRPEAIVLQCGADSLCGDRLGNFNLTFDGHADCVAFVKSLGVPMLVLGGGGYTLNNVARCWANETGVLVGETLPNDIPECSKFYDFFKPCHKLRSEMPPRHENQNTKEYLQAIKQYTMENLRQIRGAPSVQMQPLLPSHYEEESLRFNEYPDDERPVDHGDDVTSFNPHAQE